MILVVDVWWQQGGEAEMVEEGGVDEMSFCSTVEGSSNGESDGGTECRRWWPCQCGGIRESFSDSIIINFFVAKSHQHITFVCSFVANFYAVSYLFLDHFTTF